MIYNFDKLEFCPISVGHFTHRDGFFEVKGRPYASISFRTRGTGRFEIGGKCMLSTVGNIYFIPAHTPYRVEYTGSESIVVHLENCNCLEAELICPHNASLMEGRFQKLLTAWNEQHSVNQAKSILYDLLDKLSEDQKTVISDAAFERCLAYIHASFCDPELDIEKICARGFISASGLQRKFYRHFEMSPKQYLIKLRMNKALELLIADKIPIQTIAYSCGFSDVKYFSRAFKEYFGYPPSQMKKHILI